MPTQRPGTLGVALGLTECGTQWQLHNGMIEFVLESAPEGGNLEVWGANLDGCQGRVNVQYNATALGTYSGQFNLGGCEGHYVPFSVTFQDGSGTSVVSSDLAWGFMNGGTRRHARQRPSCRAFRLRHPGKLGRWPRGGLDRAARGFQH